MSPQPKKPRTDQSNHRVPVASLSTPGNDGEPANLRVRLREDAIGGILVPGQRLKLDELRARYNASVGSLREALVQLVSEGFVVAEPNRGFCVAPISLADLDDITERRVEIERQALTMAIEYGDDRWEANLVAAYHMLAKIVVEKNSAALRRTWWERHNVFHEALVAACPSPWLLRFREVLFDHSHRYRSLSLQHSASPGRIDEHRSLTEAVLARDTVKACNLIEDHIRRTAMNVRKWVAANGAE